MTENWPAYLLAFLASFVYAWGAIAGKRALELGSGQMRTVLLSNLLLAPCFLPHLFLARDWPGLDELGIGTCLGALFLLAQVLLFRALRAGDASMVSPMMGVKSVLVAFFVVVFGLSESPLTGRVWLAAGLSAVAVAMIGWPESRRKSSGGQGILLALASAATFSLLDSLVPYFSHRTQPVLMLFCIFAPMGVLSLALLPFSEEAVFRRAGLSDKWAWRSGILIALQAVLMSSAIACYRVPTEVNVVYSSRGLWTVLLVAWFAGRLGLDEGSLSRRAKGRRLAGSLLLGVGILLIA